jgi:hypothetical protein
MSARARAASLLAEHLSAAVGMPVAIVWDNPSGRPAAGVWRLEWVDGPTTTTMRTLAAQHARWVRPLDTTTLRYSRTHTPPAWAAALLTMAERGELPDTPGEAVALVEYDLHDTDATAWATIWPVAVDLARHCDQRPALMAATLIQGSVTKPCHETDPHRCGHCGIALPTPAGTGRPRRWCSTGCRQAARRQTGPVTKPRHETFCAACGDPIRPTATGRGRRRRWCTPACRTRAWRTRGRTH